MLTKIDYQETFLHLLIGGPIKFGVKALHASFCATAFLFTFISLMIAWDPMFWGAMFEGFTRPLLVIISVLGCFSFVAYKAVPSSERLDMLFKDVVHNCPDCGLPLGVFKFTWYSLFCLHFN